MSPRILASLIVAAGLATPAAAQQIDYETGQYEYAEPATQDEGDAVVTETRDLDNAPLPAERIIPIRQAGPAPVFVPGAVVQGVDAATSTAPVQLVLPAVQMVTPSAPIYAGSGPVYYVHPGTAPGMAAPPPGYAIVPPSLPPGAQLVEFDRMGWLAACRARLAGYHPDDRDAAMAAIGGTALGYSPGRDHCEAYLDSYLASATAGTLAVQHSYGQPHFRQQYMLVPVTVLAPHQPRR